MSSLFRGYRKGSLVLLPLLALFTLAATAFDAYLVSQNANVIQYIEWRIRICTQLQSTTGDCASLSQNQYQHLLDLEKGYFSQFLPVVIGYGFAFAWSAVLFLFAISPQGQWVAPITSGLAKPKIAKALLSPRGMLAQSAVFFVYTLGTQASVTRPANNGDPTKVVEPCTYDSSDMNCQLNNAGFAMGWLSIATLLVLVVLSILGLLATPRSLGGLKREAAIKGHEDELLHQHAPAQLYSSGAAGASPAATNI
ncbi:hypothetical protein OC834_003849 [Tilletia horrida]|nr:hypothetical protein OC834_003849 [Tilletia horrida]KAK0537406.1 hypothetical protein OC835_001752 [Tilletia horrida]